MKLAIEQEINLRQRDGETDVDHITRIEYETGNDEMESVEAVSLVDLLKEYGGSK